MNRLHLDFSLDTTEQRAEFVKEYINTIDFTLSEKELTTIGDYILWGKNKDGKNPRQTGEIDLESKNKTWDSKKIESLDALKESPTFRESDFHEISEPPAKLTREVFSRDEARKKAPPHVLESLEQLWRRIDEIDLTINFYDLAHNKRKLEPRKTLLERFTQNEIYSIQQKAESLSQFHYLKLRHLLVELRREQFTLRDSYAVVHQPHGIPVHTEVSTPVFSADISVRPAGLVRDSGLPSPVWNKDHLPVPQDFSESELAKISKFIWGEQKDTPLFFDFREPEHLYQLFLMREDLDDGAMRAEVFSTLPSFMETLDFYVQHTRLSDLHKEILNLKIKKVLNQKIADIVNSKYGKTYNANYISTIFKQKIIVSICETAKLHWDMIQNLFFEENFKKCSTCGQIYLLDARNFIRKAKAKDGFSARCKHCDKKIREMKK